MAIVATMYECPTCKTNGKTALLSADVMKNLMFCDGGHQFQADEFESGLAEPEPIASMPPPPPPTQLSVEELELSPAQKPKEDPPAPEPPPAAPSTASEKLSFKPEPIREEPKFEGADVHPLPGGAVRVSLVVPELHWMGIKAEAENQRQTPMQYLQEAFERGLEFRWIY